MKILLAFAIIASFSGCLTTSQFLSGAFLQYLNGNDSVTISRSNGKTFIEPSYQDGKQIIKAKFRVGVKLRPL